MEVIHDNPPTYQALLLSTAFHVRRQRLGTSCRHDVGYVLLSYKPSDRSCATTGNRTFPKMFFNRGKSNGSVLRSDTHTSRQSSFLSSCHMFRQVWDPSLGDDSACSVYSRVRGGVRASADNASAVTCNKTTCPTKPWLNSCSFKYDSKEFQTRLFSFL